MQKEKKDYTDAILEFAKKQASKKQSYAKNSQKYSKNKQKRAYIQFLMPKAYKTTSQKK